MPGSEYANCISCWDNEPAKKVYSINGTQRNQSANAVEYTECTSAEG